MPIQDSESMIRQVLLSLIEAGINKAISLDENSQEHLQQLAGRVVRIRTYGPYYSAYVLFDEEGVQILNHYDGPVDARIRGAAVELAKFIFGPDPDAVGGHLKVRIIGDREVVSQLRSVGAQVDFWALVRQLFKEWLPEHDSFMDVLDSLRIYDPAWLDRLQHLPQSVSQSVIQLQHLAEVQQQQAEELRVIRRHLENQRQAAKLNVAIGVVLLIMGGLMLQGAINVPLASDGSLLSIVLLTLGGMLVIPALTQLRGP